MTIREMTVSNSGIYSFYAVLNELNEREFKKKLSLFPEELRFHVILANSIVGSENAKRVKEMPEAITSDSDGFVSKLLEINNPRDDKGFREILEIFLVETLKDELKFSCMNCRKFNECLDIENLSVGELFRRRVQGEESDDLKKMIRKQIDDALMKTPHVESDEAQRLCEDFDHCYDVATIGDVFGRYREIALSLQNDFGVDYQKIQHEMIRVNMEFTENIHESGRT